MVAAAELRDMPRKPERLGPRLPPEKPSFERGRNADHFEVSPVFSRCPAEELSAE
jgi:hypothetical protein